MSRNAKSVRNRVAEKLNAKSVVSEQKTINRTQVIPRISGIAPVKKVETLTQVSKSIPVCQFRESIERSYQAMNEACENMTLEQFKDIVENSHVRMCFRVRMTREIVEYALTKNTMNRIVSKQNLEKMKNECRQGRWNENNGNSISFIREGDTVYLGDGQHRLFTFMETGKFGYATEVFVNLEPDSNESKDIGKPRSNKDHLTIYSKHGILEEKVVRHFEKTVKWLALYDDQSINNTIIDNYRISSTTLKAHIEQYGYCTKSINFVLNISSSLANRLGSVPVFSALHAICSNWPMDRFSNQKGVMIGTFFRQVLSGDTLELSRLSNVCKKKLELLRKNTKVRNDYYYRQVMAIFLTAWCQYLEGNSTCKTLNIATDKNTKQMIVPTPKSWKQSRSVSSNRLAKAV